jgi:hypothetical protein
MPLFNDNPNVTVYINNYVTNSVGSGGADVSGSYVLVNSSSNLPEGQEHELLQQLIHLSNDDGPRGIQWPNNLVKDTGPAGNAFPSASVWWTDSTRTKKVVEQQITRNSSQLPVTVQWLAYASDGVTVVESYTDTITYSGVIETTRTRSQP